MPSRTYSSDDNLNQGDLVHAASITRRFYVGEATLADTFKAPKGQYLVFLYLGWEPKDGSKRLNAIQVLKDMGWTPPPGLEAEYRNELAAGATEVAK